MRLEVTGFFDDRSTDRLGMETDAKLIGTLSDLSQYVKEQRARTSFSSRCRSATSSAS